MIKNYYKKSLIVLIIILAVLAIIWFYNLDYSGGVDPEFGVTFSEKYAKELNLDWQEAFIAILDELGVKKFRLITYWDVIEKTEGNYDFNDLDWQINEVKERGGEVILAIGHRVPRWPECHWPNWVYNYSERERDKRIKDFLTAIVNHYKNEPTIISWQIENEPFLNSFGECPNYNLDFYKEEVALVKSLDNRPITITESGELSSWFKGANLADQVGVSVYRITWSKIFGYFYYPLPPGYYYLKDKMVSSLSPVKEIFVSELQMEPWVPIAIAYTKIEDQYKSMNPTIFQKNLEYIKKTGLTEVYLWGAEWWYWLTLQADESIWNLAKEIWQTK